MIRRVFVSGALLALTGTYAIRAADNGGPRCETTPPADIGVSQAGTVKAGIYSKEQADRGKVTFDKICAACHTFKPSEKSKDNPDLGGEAFLAKWDNRSVHELATVIYTTMPNDGSAVISEAETTDVVAYILQQNTFPAGSQPFKWDTAARKIMIVK